MKNIKVQIQEAQRIPSRIPIADEKQIKKNQINTDFETFL